MDGKHVLADVTLSTRTSVQVVRCSWETFSHVFTSSMEVFEKFSFKGGTDTVFSTRKFFLPYVFWLHL